MSSVAVVLTVASASGAGSSSGSLSPSPSLRGGTWILSFFLNNILRVVKGWLYVIANETGFGRDWETEKPKIIMCCVGCGR